MNAKKVWELTTASLSVLRVVIEYYKKNVDDEISEKLEDAFYEIMKINNNFFDSNIH